VSKITKSELRRRLNQQKADILRNQPIPATIESRPSGFLVDNWQHGWKWFSNLALTAIVAVNAVPIPPEVINALPAHTQSTVTIGLAVVGVLGRFINQARNKPLPPISNEVVDGN
jgi:hypothetical protein